MIRSGLNVPTPEIPIPALAVPYAAPIAVYRVSHFIILLIVISSF